MLNSAFPFRKVVCAFLQGLSLSVAFGEEKVFVNSLFISKTHLRSHSRACCLFNLRLRVSSWALEIKRCFEIAPVTPSEG